MEERLPCALLLLCFQRRKLTSKTHFFTTAFPTYDWDLSVISGGRIHYHFPFLAHLHREKKQAKGANNRFLANNIRSFLQKKIHHLHSLVHLTYRSPTVVSAENNKKRLGEDELQPGGVIRRDKSTTM